MPLGMDELVLTSDRMYDRVSKIIRAQPRFTHFSAGQDAPPTVGCVSPNNYTYRMCIADSKPI